MFYIFVSIFSFFLGMTFVVIDNGVNAQVIAPYVSACAIFFSSSIAAYLAFNAIKENRRQACINRTVDAVRLLDEKFISEDLYKFTHDLRLWMKGPKDGEEKKKFTTFLDEGRKREFNIFVPQVIAYETMAEAVEKGIYDYDTFVSMQLPLILNRWEPIAYVIARYAETNSGFGDFIMRIVNRESSSEYTLPMVGKDGYVVTD